MNALRAIFMDHRRRKSIRPGRAAAALSLGLMALSLFLVVPAVSPHQSTGESVHAKNGATPDWIVDLQTRNAGQLPAVVESDEPSFWI